MRINNRGDSDVAPLPSPHWSYFLYCFKACGNFLTNFSYLINIFLFIDCTM